MAANSTMQEVFTIIEREGLEKAIWLRVGTCFTNRDGSFNVFLDALPVNGKLQIRQRQEREERAAG
jgi:hypothetical protein